MSAITAVQIKELEAYFADRPDVSFAFLFGSQARGTAGAVSDVDIAVYFAPADGGFDYESDQHYPAEDGVWTDLESMLKRDVEVLVLNRASPNIAASALRGVRLAVNDWGLYADFMLHATAEAQEFRADALLDFLEERDR